LFRLTGESTAVLPFRLVGALPIGIAVPDDRFAYVANMSHGVCLTGCRCVVVD